MLLIPTHLAASGIHGLGVVASVPVQAGTPVWRFEPNFDSSFKPEQIDLLPPTTREFVRHFGYWDRQSGCWILNGDHGRFMNHSDSPNTGVRDPSHSGTGILTTVALTDLPAGTELTCDYREFDGDVDRKLSGSASHLG